MAIEVMYLISNVGMNVSNDQSILNVFAPVIDGAVIAITTNNNDIINIEDPANIAIFLIKLTPRAAKNKAIKKITSEAICKYVIFILLIRLSRNTVQLNAAIIRDGFCEM